MINDKPVLPYKRNLALRRIENLEKKFSKNQLLSRKYSETKKGILAKVMRPKSRRPKDQNATRLPITYLISKSLTNINQIN